MMASRMIVTNLRIDEHDWNQIRAVAAEMGISANEYVKRVLKEAAARQQLGVEMKKNATGKRKRNNFLLELSKIAEKVPNQPMGLSEEDEIIYGV